MSTTTQPRSPIVGLPASIAESLSHYLMPAEWEPHQGTILTWPHHSAIWRGVHNAVEVTFGYIAAKLSHFEDVHINVPDAEYQKHAARFVAHVGGDMERVHWHLIDSDDVWARDHGPIFVKLQSTAFRSAPPLVMLKWIFNAWGGKFAFELDDQVPRKMNDLPVFYMPRVEPGIVMEGGSLEVNGYRDLLVTRSVLFNKNRNPGRKRREIELILKQTLGVDRIHWLNKGLAGDDTDGHIDDIARFVNPDTIVVVSPEKGHPDFYVMQENKRLLADMRGFQDARFVIDELPMPEPVDFRGEHLPASYANFYIANGIVLVPVFNQRANDERALGILKQHFPDRRVVGIDCRALVTQYGGIHCVTQQIPAPPAE